MAGDEVGFQVALFIGLMLGNAAQVVEQFHMPLGGKHLWHRRGRGLRGEGQPYLRGVEPLKPGPGPEGQNLSRRGAEAEVTVRGHGQVFFPVHPSKAPAARGQGDIFLPAKGPEPGVFR